MQRAWNAVKTRGFNHRVLIHQSVPPYLLKHGMIGSLLAARSFSNQNYITPFLINNEEIISDKKFDVRNPRDSKLLWSASAATISDVKRVTQAASAAFPSWSTTKLVKRRELLLKFADVLTKRTEDLKECMCIETAAQASWAEFNVHTAAGFVQEVAGRVTNITGIIPESTEEGKEKQSSSRNDPWTDYVSFSLFF